MAVVQTIKIDKFCKGFFSKCLGLMFSRQRKNIVLEFNKEKRVGLHTFFVFYPIDVVFLNSNKKVVEVKRLKPFRFYNPKCRAKYIIELGKGKLNKSTTDLRLIEGT